MTIIQRVAGSFRDPSGFVFFRDDEVYRSIDQDCCEVLMELADQGKIEEWVERNVIVGTEFVQPGDLLSELRAELPDAHEFLRHEPIQLVTYPYELSLIHI